MALKVFKKFGLKRELNLSDVPSKKIALNNLLDGLSDGITSFTWEDINLIQNIYLTELNTGTFSTASGATVKKIQPNGDLEVYDPLITLENRFDKAYFTTSEPFFAGASKHLTRRTPPQLRGPYLAAETALAAAVNHRQSFVQPG